MKHYKLILLLFFFILSEYKLLSQGNFFKGYIITNEMDTINGLIRNNGYINNSLFCKFKVSKKGKILKYLPQDLFGYRFNNGKYYISKDVTIDSIEHKYFLEYLIDGKLDVYFMLDQKDERFFTQKDTGKLYKLEQITKYYEWNSTTNIYEYSKTPTIERVKEDKKFIGVLKYVLSDTPELFPEIEHSRLAKSNLINIAKDYHKMVCVNEEECIEYEKSIFKYVQISAGYEFGNLKFGTFDDFDNTPVEYKSFDCPFFSISASFAGISEKMYVQFMFSQYKYNISAQSYPYTYFVSGKKTSIPILFNYNFLNTNFRPYLGIGVDFHFIDNVNIYRLLLNDQDPYYLDTMLPFYEGTFVGVILTSGIQYILFKGLYIHVAASYSNLFLHEDNSIKESKVLFSAGYKF